MPVHFLLDGGYAAFLWVHGGAAAVLTLWMLPGLVRGLGRGAGAGLAAVAVVSGWLATVQPASPQVYCDEFYYTAIAANLAATGRAEPLIWRGIPPRAERPGRFVPPYPQGWPFLLSLAVPPGTPPEPGVLQDPPWERAVLVARGLAALSPVLFFLALVRRFGAPVAVGAAVALAGLPPVLKLSGTAAAGTGSLFALVLALAALVEFRRRPGEASFAWLAVTATLPGEMRPEGLVYLPLFLLAAWPEARRLPRAVLLGGLAVAAALSVPPLVVMLSGALDAQTAHHFAATPRPGLSPWGNRLANLANNAGFFFSNRIWPLPLTLLALAGLAAARRGERAPALWACAWIGGLTLNLSYFPFGDYSCANSLDTWRFSHHVALPMLLLACLGAEGLARWGRDGSKSATGGGAVAAALLLAWAALAPLLHREFLEAPHPMSSTFRAAARVREQWQGGQVAAEAPEIFCLLRYGQGLPAVLGPVTDVPPGGLRVFAVEGEAGLPDLRFWSPLELDPEFVEPGDLGRAGLFRVREGPPAL